MLGLLCLSHFSETLTLPARAAPSLLASERRYARSAGNTIPAQRSVVPQCGAAVWCRSAVWCWWYAVWRHSPVLEETMRSYSPRRGDTHAVQVAPYKRSAVW